MEPAEVDGGSADETFFDASSVLLPAESDEAPNIAAGDPPSSGLRRRRLSPATNSTAHQSRTSSSITDRQRLPQTRNLRNPSDDADRTVTGDEPPPPPPSPDLLLSLTGIIVKALGFQISLLVGSVAFPLRLLCSSLSLAADPRRTLNRGAEELRRVGSSFLGNLAGGGRGAANLALRVSVGCFWSLFVLSTLVACLASALLVGKLVAALAMEKPLDFAMDLSFDYTRNSPAAEVPFPHRLVPPGRRLKSTVSLILPESEYNRKLGIFQVKVEFLTGEGKKVASSSRPCMLQFKSAPIRYLEIFIKSGLLLADYSSESQMISLSMGGFEEGAAPTVAARVVLERRAEQKPGAGLPEIYAASLRIESELPLVKKLLWRWRRTLFVGLSIFTFNFELLLLLICCTPLLLPGSFRRGGSPPPG